MCLRFMVDLEINFLFLYLICFYLAYLASLFNSGFHLMPLIGVLVAPLIGYILFACRESGVNESMK